MQGKRKPPTICESVGGDSSRKRRAVTHTLYIISLSGTVCKLKKSGRKAAFSGSYGIVTNRPPAGHTRRALHEDNIQGETVCLRRISRRLYLPGIFADEQDRKAKQEETFLSRSKETQSKAQRGETRPAPPCEFYPGRPRNPFDIRATAGERRGGGSISTQLHSPRTESKETPRAPSAEIHSRYRERLEKRSLSSSRYIIGWNG